MTTTPRYAVHYRIPGFTWTPAAWRVRASGRIPGFGKPTAANLAAHVASVEASTRLGGVNAHLGATTVTAAWIVDQDTGDVVARYEAPAFQVSA